MEVKTVFLFKPFLGNCVKNEFSNLQDLKKYIKSFDFTKKYSLKGNPVSSNFDIFDFPPVFRVGYYCKININGYDLKTDMFWTPELWVAKSVEVKPTKDPDVLYYQMQIPYRRKNNYEEYSFALRRDFGNFCFVDKDNLKQLYPVAQEEKTEIDKIIEQALKSAKEIKVR